MLIDEVCAYLKNYFDRDDDRNPLPSWRGNFIVSDGTIDLSGKVLDGQYFRIQNSIFNDGIYKYPVTGLKDETFNGKISALKIPNDLISLLGEMQAYMEKYGGADSTALSPYNSESFGGYSYSKSTGANNGNNGTLSGPLWVSAFGGRLERWRKL